jgi:HNH endonuclease
MAISENTKKKLLANSWWYCQNPSCNTNLFSIVENGDITNIYEGAHIIWQSTSWPRGESTLELSERDEFNNIILLCPNCHTMIDKNPSVFETSILKTWKLEHNKKIEDIFKVPCFSERNLLRKFINNIMEENKVIFDKYWPMSEIEWQDVISEKEKIWQKKSLEKIIPNNKLIYLALKKNSDLLDNSEKKVLHEFSIHINWFEYNHTSWDKNGSYPRFPKEMNTLLK